MKHLLTALTAAALALMPLAGHALEDAADYPSRPIKIVVPYPPGGSVDPLARVYAQKLRDLLGQPVIIDNRPGGSGLIGTRHVLQAAPDGYTLLMTTPTLTTNTIVYKAPGYSIKEFSAVAGLGMTGLLLLANNNAPYKDLAQLIAYSKANPKKVNMGTLGAGGVTQLLTSRFQHILGLQTLEVPYKGGGMAMQDLLAGNIDIYLDPMATAVPQLHSGRILALASTTEERSPLAPDVPTFNELGFPEMSSAAWFGVHVSSSTPASIVEKLRKQYAIMMQSKDFLDTLAAVKIDPWTKGIDSFNEYLIEDEERWRKDAQRSGVVGSL